MAKNQFFKKLFAKVKLTIFLLKLLFSNKKKIRYRIFDTLHLNQFFNDDGWREILNNNPNNKKINYNLSNSRTAVLIPGRLRCWAKSKDLIYSIAEKNKVFIMTDHTDTKIVEEINHHNILTKIVEKSDYKKENEKVSNPVLSQYFKLKCAINEIYKFEKENSFIFNNFIKIRTDFHYLNAENLLDMSLENNQEYLFAQSDLHYSGRREFFLPLRNFYEFSEWAYRSDFHNLDYMPINPSQIINSDPGATRFNWLKYPKKIVETTERRPSGEFIYKKIFKNFKEAIEYKFNTQDEMKKTGGQDYFATEQSFALFLNLAGIPCKTHPKFLGFIMNYEKKFKNGLKAGVLEYRNDMKKLKKNN